MVSLAVVVMLAAGCGGGSTKPQGVDDALDIPIQADLPGGADPDLFYDIEGLQITNNVYQGLLTYGSDEGREIVGELAKSWKVSDDGLTYTFELADGIKFHDGTPFNAEAMKKAFERRSALEGGPSYMLAEVQRMETPDERTFVVHLKTPNNAFLDHLAGPYGPKAISPTAVEKNAKGDDLAAKWLASHDAGTGPYTLAEVQPGRRYVLEAAKQWSGTKPQFKTINFPIIPDVSTQILQLQQGELDMISHGNGLPRSDLEAMADDDQLSIHTYPTALKELIYLNPGSGPFQDPALRRAFQAALEREPLVSNAFGETTAAVTDGLYPDPALNEGGAVFDGGEDAGALSGVSGEVDIASNNIAIGGAASRQIAELVQTQLSAKGIKATTREIGPAQIYELPTKPALRPDVLVITNSPDDLHADSFARIFFATGGAVNWLGCSSKEADSEMDAGLAAGSEDESTEHYRRVAQLVYEAGCVVPVADVKDVYVARAGIDNLVHNPAAPFVLRFEELRRN
jgi:peptide/nickel transport system substrate-binding protein